MGFMKGALAASEQAESDTLPPHTPSLTPGIIHRALGVGGGRHAEWGEGVIGSDPSAPCQNIESVRNRHESIVLFIALQASIIKLRMQI